MTKAKKTAKVKKAEAKETETLGKQKTKKERAANIPKFMRLTPQTLEQIAAEQAERAAKVESTVSPFQDQPYWEKERDRAIRNEAHFRTILAVNPEEQMALMQLAEALVIQGRYLEAALVEPDQDHAREYIRLHVALHRNDNAWCEHEKYYEKDGVRFANFTREKRQWLDAHGAFKFILRCNICRFANVTDEPDESRKLDGIRTNDKTQAVTYEEAMRVL